ncbi:MAG: DUF1330 domain-containing protein [Pseudomonadota bacterium]
MAKGYLIGRVEVHDPLAYGKFLTRNAKLIASHGGRDLARGGQVETLEGETDDRRLVIVEFPSFEAARGFYFSEEFVRLKALRDAACDAQFILTEGIPQT